MEREQSKHRGGRPVKAIKREAATGIRFTKAEYFIIKQKAKNAGMKPGRYIREMALEGKVLARLNTQEKQMIRQLVGMANNLNQLAKLAHKQRMLSALMLFDKYRSEIDNILLRLKNDQQSNTTRKIIWRAL